MGSPASLTMRDKHHCLDWADHLIVEHRTKVITIREILKLATSACCASPPVPAEMSTARSCGNRIE